MIHKPFWKIVKRANNEYAEMLLRCKPDEHQEARQELERFGSILQATDAILSKFGSNSEILPFIVDELTRQHAQQLDAIKKLLKENVGNFIFEKSASLAATEEVESIIDDVWDSIES